MIRLVRLICAQQTNVTGARKCRQCHSSSRREASNVPRIKQGFAQPSSRSSVPSQQWHPPLQLSVGGFCADLVLLLLPERVRFRLSLPPIPPLPPTANEETSQLSSCFDMVRVNGMVRAHVSPAGVIFRSPERARRSRGGWSIDALARDQGLVGMCCVLLQSA